MTDSPKLLIGVPTASGAIPLHTVISLMHMVQPMAYRFTGTARVPTVMARNLIARAAVNDGFDYLLFIDDDNPAPQDTIEKLLAADKDVIGGAYVARIAEPDGRRRLCASYRDRSGDYTAIREWREPGPLHRVDVVAAGCMLIKRHVLVALDREHRGAIFDIERDAEGELLNEDVVFCGRAIAAGFEVWLHEDVRPQHIAEPELVQWSGTLGTDAVGLSGERTAQAAA